ncbi:MAG: hypothetical protein R3F56_00625 [Planctomycetota bacterium]
MTEDPWTLLGLEPGARPEQIEAACRRALAAASDAAAVARVEAARARVSDPRACARERLFGPPPFSHLDEIAEALCRLPRRPVGAVLWLEALREG